MFYFKEQQTTFCAGIKDDVGTWSSVDVFVAMHATASTPAGREGETIFVFPATLPFPGLIPSISDSYCVRVHVLSWLINIYNSSSFNL